MATENYCNTPLDKQSVSLSLAKNIDPARAQDGRVLINHLPALLKADLIMKTSRDAAKERTSQQNTKKLGA